MRATHLLIPGHVEPDGGEKCCICGCNTTRDYKGFDYFKDTFRDYRDMQVIESPYVCSMCALSLKDVPSGIVTYIDGSKKTPKTDKRGLGYRFFSWYLVDGKEPIGATKAHCKELRKAMLNPPINTYFAFIIAESGQKQLIYRFDAQRILSADMPYEVQYEAERVIIDKTFWHMLRVADNLATLFGKSRVLDPVSYLTLSKYIEAYGGDAAEDCLFFASRLDTAQARLCGFLAMAEEK